MGTALVGLAGVLIGTLLGGGVQLVVNWHDRRMASRRAARLLFGDHWLASSAVKSLNDLEYWWSDEMKPPLEGWHRYREELAGAMYGPAFQTVDGAFYRVAGLEDSRRAGLKPADVREDAELAYKQLYEAGGLLLVEGFRGGELKAMQAEMETGYRTR
jgi:hypothetical protein